MGRLNTILAFALLTILSLSFVGAGAELIDGGEIKDDKIIVIPDTPLEDRAGWSVDNLKSFEQTEEMPYGKVTITNSFLWFIPTGKVEEIELKENTDICGIDCFAIKEITIYTDTKLIDSVKFYTINEDGSRTEQPIRSYQFYLKNGTDGWIPYDYEVMPAGTYTVKLEGQKRPTRTVDWIITSQGQEIGEWAVWNGNYEAYINFVYGNRKDYDNLTVNSGTTIIGGNVQYNEVYVAAGAILQVNNTIGWLNITAYNVTILGTIDGLGMSNQTGASGGSGSDNCDAGYSGSTATSGGTGGQGGPICTDCDPYEDVASGGSAGSQIGDLSGRYNFQQGWGAGGGGGGQGGASTYADGENGATGNSGGAGIRIDAGYIISKGTITARGGAGGKGGDGYNGGYNGCGDWGDTTGGGGGGGSSAGTILLDGIFVNVSSSTINVAGGAGGVGGTCRENCGESQRHGLAGATGAGGRFKVFSNYYFNSSTTMTTTGGATTYYSITSMDGTVTLNSPANAYISPTNSVQFNCSVTILDGSFIENLTLLTNESGSWSQVKSWYTEPANILYDDFSIPSNQINTTKWTNATGGSGAASITVASNQANLIGDADCSGASCGYKSSNAEITSKDNNFTAVNFTIVSEGSDTSCTAGNGWGWGEGTREVIFGGSVILDKLTTCSSGGGAPAHNTAIYGDLSPGNYTLYKNGTNIWVLYKNNVYVRTMTIAISKGSLKFNSVGVGQASGTTANGKGEAHMVIRDIYYYDEPTSKIISIYQNIYSPTDWTCQACDTDGMCGFASENRTLSVDITPPDITILYPTGNIPYGYMGQNISLNYSITDANIDSCWYNYGAGNVTIPCYGAAYNSTEYLKAEYSELEGLTDNVYGNDGKKFGQSFTIGSITSLASDLELDKVGFLLQKVGSPSGSMNLNLYATDINGIPTGGALSTGSVNANDISSKRWYNFTMTSYKLQKGVKYAIVWEGGSWTGSNYINWFFNNSNSYPGGALLYDFGSWTEDSAKDRTFQIYGTANVTKYANYFTLTNQKNITLYANDSIGNINYTTSNWTYTIFQNSISYNSTTYETASETFTINATGMTNANLIYDGTTYAATISGNIATKTISIPQVSGTTTKNFYWSFNSNSVNSTTYNQTIYPIIFGLCNATNNVSLVNYTFKDESSYTLMNASIDAATFTYSLSSSNARTYYYTTTTDTPSFAFCGTPKDRTFTLTGDIRYSSDVGATYPQRRYQFSAASFTNSTTNTILYLLSASEGIYSTYQVVTTGNAVIPGAHLTVYRDILGTQVLVGEGDTDSAGSITFFLNPNYDHTITVSKTGYASQTVTIRPTQSIYTFTLGTSGALFVYNGPLEGVTWRIYPISGPLEFGVYNFTFTVNSSKLNIDGCNMSLYLKNGTTLASAGGCSAGGGTIGIYNFNYTQRMYGGYSLVINGSTIIIDADAQWHYWEDLLNASNTGFGINNALKDFYNSTDWGNNPETADFNRIVFFFLLFAIIFAALNFFTSYDTAYPGAMLVCLWFAVLILSLINGITGPGWFYLSHGTLIGCTGTYPNVDCNIINTIFNNWIVFIYVSLVFATYILTTLRRYQS